MEPTNKPIWEILNNLADSTDDPAKKAKMKEDAEKMRIEADKTRKELVGRYIMARILDLFAVLSLVAVIIIVIILFSKSLFEGFISLVAGFFIIRWIFIKRNNDFSSKFFGWF